MFRIWIHHAKLHKKIYMKKYIEQKTKVWLEHYSSLITGYETWHNYVLDNLKWITSGRPCEGWGGGWRRGRRRGTERGWWRWRRPPPGTCPGSWGSLSGWRRVLPPGTWEHVKGLATFNQLNEAPSCIVKFVSKSAVLKFVPFFLKVFRHRSGKLEKGGGKSCVWYLL